MELEKKQGYWEGLAAGYFFLSTLGIMMFAVLAFLDLAGAGLSDQLNAWTGLVALVVAAIGPLLLILELGNKKKAYLLAITPPSIMTVGPVILGVGLVLDLIYSASFFNFIPWYGMTGVRVFCAVVGIILALGFTIYPGFELGEAKGRGFWNTGGLVPLFIISGATTGLAGVMLMAAVFGASGGPALKALNIALLVALVVQLVAIVAYVWGMKHAGAEEARRAAEIILRGDFSASYKFGVLFCGSIAPLILYLFGAGAAVLAIKALLILIGAACLRSVFLQAAVRKTLPGEENIWYTEEETAELAARLEQRWQEKASWLNSF